MMDQQWKGCRAIRISFDLLKMLKKDGWKEPPTKRMRQLLERVAGQCRVGRYKGSGAIRIFLWLVENAKEGCTKQTTYKESEAWVNLVFCRNTEQQS
jgi:hypothetical protein